MRRAPLWAHVEILRGENADSFRWPYFAMLGSWPCRLVHRTATKPVEVRWWLISKGVDEGLIHHKWAGCVQRNRSFGYYMASTFSAERRARCTTLNMGDGTSHSNHSRCGFVEYVDARPLCKLGRTEGIRFASIAPTTAAWYCLARPSFQQLICRRRRR